MSFVFAAERRQLILEMVRANGAVSLRELARVVQTSEVTVPAGRARTEGRRTPRPPAWRCGIAGRVHAGVRLSARNRISRPPRRRPSPISPRVSSKRARPSWWARAPLRRSWRARLAQYRADRRHQLPAGGTGAGPCQPRRGRDDRRHPARFQLRPGRQRRRAVPPGAAGLAGLPLRPWPRRARGLSTSNMLSASVDRALVQAAAEVVVLADHTKLGTDTMSQTVPTDLITRAWSRTSRRRVTVRSPRSRAPWRTRACRSRWPGSRGGGTGGDAVPTGRQPPGHAPPGPTPQPGAGCGTRRCAALPSWASSPGRAGASGGFAPPLTSSTGVHPHRPYGVPSSLPSAIPPPRYGKRPAHGVWVRFVRMRPGLRRLLVHPQPVPDTATGGGDAQVNDGSRRSHRRRMRYVVLGSRSSRCRPR